MTSGPARLWLKTVKKDGSHTVQAYEIDCQGGRINATSTVQHDPNGEVVNTIETSGGRQPIVPGTRGEQLYNGMCSGVR